MTGPPIVRRPPERVLINPLDAAPPTMEVVLHTPDDQLAELWPAPANTDIPVIHLPGTMPSTSDLVITA